MEWQPIETAPKDGTWILAIVSKKINYVPVVVKWGKESWSNENITMDGRENLEHWHPTHWMALPEPPQLITF